MSETVLQFPGAQEDRFEEFWAVYPRKIGKALARAKWTAITNGGLRTRTLDRDSQTFVEIELRATPSEIIEGAKRYREAMYDRHTRQFSKYICHPATWLNQGRWEDGN